MNGIPLQTSHAKCCLPFIIASTPPTEYTDCLYSQPRGEVPLYIIMNYLVS